ncbi:MAG: hypothetical protein VX341_03515 [Bdellovibrionota bacterium]|nr:hypothetical protein [Bdellovibrionota bacterium]
MKILFTIILFLSTHASEDRIDFLGEYNQITTEEEFLKRRGTDKINKKEKEYEIVKKRCQHSNDFKCNLDLSTAKFFYERSFEKRAHSEVILREELNNRLNQCLSENKQDVLYPCLKAEFKWWTERVRCGQLHNYKSSKSKSCITSVDEALNKAYQENKSCNKENYIIKDNIKLGSLSNLFYFYKDSKNWPKEPQNTYLNKVMKCMMSAYYDKKRFKFNPEDNNFLIGSTKTKYLSLISSDNRIINSEKLLIRFTPSINTANFLRFSNTFGYNRPNYLIFSKKLTGEEKFLKEMIKTTNYNKTLKEDEAAKKYLGRRIPISHPDNSTRITQEDGPFMKYESYLGVNAEFISGHALSKPRFSGEFVSTIPEFNSEGKVLWKDKEKGFLRWAKIGKKLAEKLKPYVKLNNDKISIRVSLLPESESLIFSVAEYIDRYLKPLAEFKATKKKTSDKVTYVFESDYEGYLTKKYQLDIDKKKERIKHLQRSLTQYNPDHPQYKSIQDQINKHEMILKQVTGDEFIKEVQNDNVITKSMSEEPSLPSIKKQPEVAQRKTESSKNKKEKSNVSVKIDGYKSLINGCYSDGIGGSLVDIHDKRRNSFLDMISKLESINCSNIEGKGCHSKEARELIIKHYYIEKKSHQEALAWKENTDNPNADQCLKVYGFMR